MRIVLVAVGLVILLAVGWVLKGLMSDRDERDFAVHYSWIVKWALTLSRETQRAPAGASFDSPRIEVAGHPNRWVVSGNVNWRDAAGSPVREPYTAVVENVCKAYADADCWELQGFAMGEPAIDLAESALANAAEGTVAQAPAPTQQTAAAPAPAQQADQKPEPDAVLALLEEGAPSTPEGAVPDAPPLPMADGIPLPERKPSGPPGTAAEDAAFALADVGELPDAEDSQNAIADAAQPAASEADIGAAIADAGVLGAETGGASQDAGASAIPEAEAVEPVVTADAAPAAPVEEEPITADPVGGASAGVTELTLEEPESTETEAANLGAPAQSEPALPQQPAPSAPAQPAPTAAAQAPAEPAPAEAEVAAVPAEPVTEIAEAEAEAQIAALPPEAGAVQPSPLPEEDAGSAVLPGQSGAAAQPGVDAALVVLLQDRLDRAGYDPGPVDGRLGGRTQSALREFERDAGLPVTGQPSRTALAALEELLASRNAAPQPQPKPQVAALPPTPPLPPQPPATAPTAAPAVPAPAPATAVAPAPTVAPAAPPATATRSVVAPAQPANLLQPAPAALPAADESLIFLIQHRLRQAGFSPGRFDGRMNEATANAIRQYQSRNGLAVDGVPSRALLEQLEGDVLGGEGRQPAAPTPLGAVPCAATGGCAVLPG
ncbi:MAG TPA: peptidoglycan-binding domain-containing protein [Alphaproteobacteria bacterium]